MGSMGRFRGEKNSTASFDKKMSLIFLSLYFYLQNYLGLGNGARLYDMDGLNKMLPLSEYNTNSSNLYSIELSQNGFPFTWKPLFVDSKDN